MNFLIYTIFTLYFRYPYYITQIYKKENSVLTWLRYTIWMPLYPLGFYCEAVIIYRSITFIDEIPRYTVSMPNDLNFTFHFATFLRIYLLTMLVPGMYTMLSYMYKARVKKLGKGKVKSK